MNRQRTGSQPEEREILARRSPALFDIFAFMSRKTEAEVDLPKDRRRTTSYNDLSRHSPVRRDEKTGLQVLWMRPGASRIMSMPRISIVRTKS
ncbi:hypothetical protein GE061_007028 [Apolygus lucorum]|uniref:Uncharacterized protein n=1 Tax=Apolygus lucorum TaxID=248454 RepID=A0A8S9WUD8_APOLU|nr:hypothetical protein GE061_007028 [Apolygus lucorum]